VKSICPIPLRAVAIFISCLALGFALPARAEQPAAPAKAAKAGTHDHGPAAAELIQKLESAGNAEERMSLANQLIELRPAPVEHYKTHLARPRSSSDEERRAVLAAAGAAVPDDKGRFKVPGRETKKTEKSNDDFDWLSTIAGLRSQAGIGEVVSDVAVIRALASSKDHTAGHVIVEFAFTEIGLIFRDECGRYLRKMSPFSIPALIHGSQKRRNKSMKRYTTYQLERLDRQNPHKAFAAAPTEDLQIAIVNAFADSQYRESVFAVLANVNHVAPRVRKATRAAWDEFVDGRPPPKPPERKLELPNNKLTDEKEPLWLDHRQLANVAIREQLEKLTGSKPPKKATLVQMTEQLYGFYDEERKVNLNTDFAAALDLAKAGKPGQATVIFDRILAQHPTFSKREQMVPAYLAQAEALEKESKWKEAGIAYGKASAVAPESEQAKDALKKHHLARVKAAEAEGKDASTELAIAGEIEASQGASTESKLLLFAGLAAVAGAIVLLLLGMTLRRRSPGHAR
jgi:tetratricopeptide (TPR) repeat protein